MVRIASSFLSAAVLFSSYVSAAPAVKRQDITPSVPSAGEGGLNTIDPNAIPTGVDPNGSAGNSVQFPTATEPVAVPPVETAPPAESAPPVESVPPPAETVAMPPAETVAMPPPAETVVMPPVETVMAPPPPPPVETVVMQPPPVHPMPPPSHQTVGMPVYGSGSINWQVNYNDCVQVCFAQHTPPPTVVTLPPQTEVSMPPPPPPSANTGMTEVVTAPSAEGTVAPPPPEQSAGTGTVHDIMVEPSAGAPRYMPAFINAAAGDTIRFVFVNGVHSVVQSSPVAPCNATVGGFSSGQQQAGGVFTTVVKDTNPVFFYSDVGTDCQAGLFGGINGATGNENSQTTVAALMPKWAEANADIKAALAATSNSAVNTPGVTWGNKLETKDIPPEFHMEMAKNVLFTRAVISKNAEMVRPDGVFHPTGEVVIPDDVSTLIAVADAGGYPPVAPAAPAGEVSTAAQNNIAAETGAPTTDGAGSILSSRAAVAGFALLGAFFML